MLVFFPNHSHKPNLLEMEKADDKRCIWLRDDFMKNSGGQGDLRDEPQQILLDETVLENEMAEHEEQRQDMVDTTLVAALPSSRSPLDELPTVHEIR